MNTIRTVRFIGKPLVFIACLLPFALLLGDTFLTQSLGANPIEEILDRLGNWGIRFVMIVLAVTPLRQITGWTWMTRFRRMLGLFAFFYVLMHFLTWFILDQEMLVSAILEDLIERPFITLGFTALVLLTAMALTSTSGIRRRMGRRWDKLHYSVYVVGVLAVWHYWWQVKSDITEPLIYASILAALLGFRLWKWRGRQRKLARHSTTIVEAST